MAYEAKNPDKEWFECFFSKKLLQARPYKIETTRLGIKLDQNECPFDWPDNLKEKITHALSKQSWNRYAEPYPIELQSLVADYAGVYKQSVLLCPGSNYHISLLLNLFSRSLKGKIIVARPSFPLYEAHCHYENIPYQTWDLNRDLQYDFDLLPNIPTGSVIIFASPNNPVGNVLEKNKLEHLLKKHQDSYFIADEAYYDFAKESYTDLIEHYPNLIILRTFSKSFGAAGIRLGYTIASPFLIEELRKLTLPFLINQFTITAISEALQDKELLQSIEKQIKYVQQEKDKVYETLLNIAQEKDFLVYPSQTNFLLLQWPNQNSQNNVLQKLSEKNIFLRDVSRKELTYALRFTIGNQKENQILMETLRTI